MKQRIAIIGAGLMGFGLSLVFAEAGHEVCVTDASPTALAAVKARIGDTLTGLGRPSDCLARVHPVESLEEAVSGVDLVIEAAPEILELKQQIFERVEAAAPRHCILASNTSVIPITAIMERVKHKDRALGTHWWNPPYLVPLVEVIEIAGTGTDVIARMMDWLSRLGKVPVHVKKDVTGFIGNRMQAALWREAISLVENGVCDARTVDLVVKNSFGARLAVLGPLENADLVGTDLTLNIHNVILKDLEDRHTPSPYLENLVRTGKLGFKSNEGFRDWSDAEIAALRKALTTHLQKSFG